MNAARILSLSLLYALSASAQANVMQTAQVIGDESQQLMNRNSARLHLDSIPLPHGESIVFVSLNPAAFGVLAIGPPGENSEQYAKAIDQWQTSQGFSGTVRWARQPNCSVASLSLAGGHFGACDYTLRVNLQSLRRASLEFGPRSHFIAAVPSWSDVQFPLESSASTPNGAKLYDLSTAQLPTSDVALSVHIAKWKPWLLGAWLTIIPLGFFASIWGAHAVRNRRASSDEVNSKLAGRILTAGNVGVMAADLALVFIVMPPHLFNSLSLLWLGKPVPPLTFTYALVVSITSALIYHNLYHLRFSKNAPNIESEQAIAYDLRFHSIERIAEVSSERNETPLSNLISHSNPNASRYFVAEGDLDTFSQVLQASVKQASQQLGITILASELNTDVASSFTVELRSKKLTASLDVVRLLPKEQLNFLISRTLVRSRISDLRLPLLLLVAQLASIGVLYLLANKNFDSLASPSVSLSLMLFIPVVTIQYGGITPWNRRRNEFVADRLAIKATDNPRAAIEVLDFIRQVRGIPEIVEASIIRPTLQQRIDRIRSTWQV